MENQWAEHFVVLKVSDGIRNCAVIGVYIQPDIKSQLIEKLIWLAKCVKGAETTIIAGDLNCK